MLLCIYNLVCDSQLVLRSGVASRQNFLFENPNMFHYFFHFQLQCSIISLNLQPNQFDLNKSASIQENTCIIDNQQQRIQAKCKGMMLLDHSISRGSSGT
mmetsp:Transcript_11810/g.21360  ORF Transcript_11810/g.21360 Transcript_11810/m.21360 type:complete len:100 (+) Transcript_11810:211-510(+)